MARRKEETKTMDPKIIIRSETDADADAITEVTAAAFKTLEISNQTEQFIIEALRAAGALTVSLVAELDEYVIGHIAFSPVTISDGTPDRIITGKWGSIMYQVSCMREYPRRFSSLSPSKDTSLRARSRFTKDSRQMVDKEEERHEGRCSRTD